jgi:DNA repair exonuclease SbcCD ATPase subunit
MRIINLQASNFKKLVAIDITPTEDMITITGANGAGKSSVLDAITAGLCGGKAIDAVPIRKGEEKGAVRIDMGEFTITRTFTGPNTYLKIETSEGKELSSPQKFLDTIVGKVSFDPLDFLNNEKAKQRDILLGLLGIDVDGLDQKEKTLREDRTVVGREVKRLEGVVKTLKWHPDLKDEVEVSVAELTGKLQEAMTHNATIEHERNYMKGIRERADVAQKRIEEMKADIKELEEGIATAKGVYKETKARVDAMEERDIKGIQAEIAGAEGKNTLIREAQAYMKAKKDLDEENKKYEGFTTKIAAIEKDRKGLLDGAPMPVEGLTFDTTGLFYRGVPLEQASDGEKLMVSLGISMALNPTLRVLSIKDGSLLDEKNKSIIRKTLAEKKIEDGEGYQLWYESVGTDGKAGILIEEGEVKNG